MITNFTGFKINVSLCMFVESVISAMCQLRWFRHVFNMEKERYLKNV